MVDVIPGTRNEMHKGIMGNHRKYEGSGEETSLAGVCWKMGLKLLIGAKM